MTSDTYVIYGLRLRDVQPIEYRYVGLTTKGATARLKRHIGDSKRSPRAGVQTWITKHASDIVSDVLQVCNTASELNSAEVEWISRLLADGHRLLNQTSGGEGAAGYRRSAVSNLRTSDSLRGHTVSEETREKLRKANTGRTFTMPPECVRRGADHPLYGVRRNTEARRKISEALLRHNLANPRPRKVVVRMSQTQQLEQFYSGREKGRHTRWHAKRGLVNPDCQWCQPIKEIK